MQDGKGIWEQEDLAAREMWQYDGSLDLSAPLRLLSAQPNDADFDFPPVAYTWRRRCRLMSFFGLLVYAPLIVLLAVLVPRT